jgi:hypothetical protein
MSEHRQTEPDPYHQQYQPQYQQPDPGAYGGYYRQPPVGYAAPPPAPPRKKRRVFMWVFLAIQVIFIIWIATGIGGNSKSMNQGVTASDRAQATQMCGNGGWQYLSPSDSLSGAGTKSTKNYTSEAQCLTDQAKDNAALDRGASTAGTAIGVGLIIVLWVILDVILGIGFLIYRLSTRSR